MPDVIDLANKRPPTLYRIDVAHHWDGRVEIWINDVPDDERSRHSVMQALLASLNGLRQEFGLAALREEDRP